LQTSCIGAKTNATNMIINLKHLEKDYKVDLSNPIDITIPIGMDGRHPRCFYAPNVVFEPVVADGFVGDIEQGGLVNFKNITINPHGNGTHTECCGHIMSGPYSIAKSLKQHHFVGALITVNPTESEDGDMVIMPEDVLPILNKYNEIAALIIRTEPNEAGKIVRDYSGTNPIYLHHTTVQVIVQKGIDHLIVDIPSIDRESDGGALKGHKTFWDINFDNEPNDEKTITELVYIDSEIEDGLFMCAIYPLRMATDATPSRVVLYSMVEV
jgi:arylformamidase